jgi:hypothetical protein
VAAKKLTVSGRFPVNSHSRSRRSWAGAGWSPSAVSHGETKTAATSCGGPRFLSAPCRNRTYNLLIKRRSQPSAGRPENPWKTRLFSKSILIASTCKDKRKAASKRGNSAGAWRLRGRLPRAQRQDGISGDARQGAQAPSVWHCPASGAGVSRPGRLARAKRLDEKRAGAAAWKAALARWTGQKPE